MKLEGPMLLTVDFPDLGRLRLSPRGAYLALANEGDRGEARVLELSSGKQVASYAGLRERPRIDFRSETELLIAHGPECWLCDFTASARRVVPALTGQGGPEWLYCCRASPDGKAVALGGWRGGLVIAGLEPGAEPRLLRLPHQGFIDEVYFSPDGKFVAAVTAPEDEDRELRLIAVLDARTGDEVRSLKFPYRQSYNYPCAFRPDNQALAVGWRDKVLLYDLYPPRSPLDPEVLFRDDSLHATGWARPTACYTLDERKEVKGVWFSKEGIVLKALSERGDAVLLAVDEDQVLQKTPPPAERPDEAWGADISASGRAVVKVEDDKVLVWDVPGWAEA